MWQKNKSGQIRLGSLHREIIVLVLSYPQFSPEKQGHSGKREQHIQGKSHCSSVEDGRWSQKGVDSRQGGKRERETEKARKREKERQRNREREGEKERT